MIQRLELEGVHLELTDDMRRYVKSKIGRTDRFLPRAIRPSVHVEVKLKQENKKGAAERTCEVVMHLPQETFTVSETTINIFAAIDITEQKLKNHIAKYKTKHLDNAVRRRFLRRGK